jgi:hypothetical protein
MCKVEIVLTLIEVIFNMIYLTGKTSQESNKYKTSSIFVPIGIPPWGRE